MKKTGLNKGDLWKPVIERTTKHSLTHSNHVTEALGCSLRLFHSLTQLLTDFKWGQWGPGLGGTDTQEASEATHPKELVRFRREGKMK